MDAIQIICSGDNIVEKEVALFLKVCVPSKEVCFSSETVNGVREIDMASGKYVSVMLDGFLKKKREAFGRGYN